MHAASAVISEQLLRGDFFICASDKQRDFWLGQLAALGRLNPATYDEEENLDELIRVVPFGLDYINDTIKPDKQPAVFPSNAGAIQALKNGQIDGLVVDLPTAFYVTAVQVPNSTILGQFPSETGGEHFGMVLAKGNSLVGCVDQALASLKSSGALAKIQQQWLAKATGAPVLK